MTLPFLPSSPQSPNLSHTNKVVQSFVFFPRERPSLPQIGRNAPSIPDSETRVPWPGSLGTDRTAAFHQPRAQSDVFDSGQAGMMNEAARMMDVDEGRMISTIVPFGASLLRMR